MATKTAQSGFALLRSVPRAQESRDGTETGEPRPTIEALHVPPGPSYVSISRPGRAKITKRPRKSGQAFVIEPVGTGPQSAVLVFPMPGHQVRANGVPAPLVAAIRPKDRLQFDGSDEVLHGTRHIENTIGPLPSEAVGTKCPICRGTFQAGARVWLCRCGQPLHMESPGDNGDDRQPLQCATFTSTCPNCGTEVAAAEEGKYTYIPEDFRSNNR